MNKVKSLLVIAVMAIPMMLVEPAQAATCIHVSVVDPVCVPDVPLPPIPPIVVPPINLPPVITTPPITVSPVVPAPPVTPPTPPPPAKAPQPAPPATPPPAKSPATPSAPVPGPVESVPQSPSNTETPPAAGTTTPGETDCKPTTPPAPVASKPITRTRYVTIAQAVSISIGALILGAVLALLGLYIMYRIGKREGEASLNEFMSDLLGLAVRSDRNENLESKA